MKPSPAPAMLAVDGSMALHLHDAHNAELTCLDCGKTTRFSSPNPGQIARIARTHRCGNPATTHWTDGGYM
jgi:hypothetical protein